VIGGWAALSACAEVVTPPPSVADAASAPPASRVAKSLELLHEGCIRHVADDCTAAGWVHDQGLGVPREAAVAATFYGEGCDGGSAQGCIYLGLHCAQGSGVHQDEAKAASLYDKACRLGSAIGCNDAGVMLHAGRGVALDLMKARALFAKACDGGSADGCQNLEAMTPRSPPKRDWGVWELELGMTGQRGKDPHVGSQNGKVCLVNPGGCPQPIGLFPEYGGGFGVVAGAGVNFKLGPLTVRAYLGGRYEHYFEEAKRLFGYDQTNSFTTEAGLGVAVGRVELRPLVGIGFLTGPERSPTQVVTVGFTLSTRVFAGMMFGMFFHQNLSPQATILTSGGGGDQALDAPVIGLEAVYRFKLSR
jgi:hypothetical protein